MKYPGISWKTGVGERGKALLRLTLSTAVLFLLLIKDDGNGFSSTSELASCYWATDLLAKTTFIVIFLISAQFVPHEEGERLAEKPREISTAREDLQRGRNGIQVSFQVHNFSSSSFI
jgi:hypothetical protein